MFTKQKRYLPVTRDLKLLLIIGGLYALATFLSSTFVNVFLWKQSGEYLDIAVYNLAIFILQPLSFIIAGKCSKKIDRIIIIRIGVVILSLFYITVLLIGDMASYYPYLLGALLGIGNGFYWLPFNLLTFEITEPETRDFFNGIFGTLQSFGGMMGPLLAGYIITRLPNLTGYSWVFFLSFFLFFVAVVCSFFLSKRKSEGKFLFRHILQERKRNKDWKSMLHAHISQGLREGFFVFIVAIWIFIATGSEMSLGIFNFIVSICSLIGYFAVMKMVKISNRKKFLLIGAVILYASVFLFVFQTRNWMLLLYGLVIGFAYPVFNVPFASLTYDIIGKAKYAKELRIEYIIVREIFLHVGKVISVLLFLVCIWFIEAEKVIPVLLLTLGAGNLIAYLFVRKIDVTFYSS